MWTELRKLRSLAVLAGMLVSGCFGPVSQFSDLSTDASLFAQRPVHAMANEVGVGLPGIGVLAVRPLPAEETGIPEEIARGIEETFLDQLRAGKPGLKIKDSSDLEDVWSENRFANRARLVEALRSEKVDYLVVAKALPVPRGINVSFKAYDIREGAGGAVIGVSLSRTVRLKTPQSLAVSPEKAASFAAQGLFPQIARQLDVEPAAFTVRSAGGQSAFVEDLTGQVVADLERLRAEIPNAGENSPVVLDLKTEVREVDQMAAVLFLVEKADGSEIARQSVVLDKTLIAEQDLPLTPREPAIEEVVLTATGQARTGPALNGPQALTVARMMARGDLVQQALGVRRTFLDPAQTPASAEWALGVLGPMMPYAESWREEETEDPELLRVRLEARVRRFDPSLADTVWASLDPKTVRAGVPIRVRVSAQRDLFVGVFAWQGDGTVSRIVPKGDRAFVEVKPGQAILLPKPGDARIVGRVPPGGPQGLGALVVVFSTAPVDFRQFGDRVADSRFLDHLAQQDSKTISVRVLPFVVRAAGM